jgi:hypothetical protein
VTPEAARKRELERDNALVRITEHMRAAIGHLRAAAHEAHVFGLNLELPPERPFLDVMSACHHIHKKD